MSQFCQVLPKTQLLIYFWWGRRRRLGEWNCFTLGLSMRQYFDVKLPIVLSGLIMSEGLRKSSPNVTIYFFAKFQSQFDRPYLSLS